MQLVLVTQYFDTLKSIGESDKTNTFVPVALSGGGKGSLRPDPRIDAAGAERNRDDAINKG